MKVITLTATNTKRKKGRRKLSKQPAPIIPLYPTIPLYPFHRA